MKKIFLTSILFAIAIAATAQKTNQKNAFGYFVNFTNNQFGFDYEFIADKPYSPSFEFYYSKYLNKKVDVIFPIQIGAANFPINGKDLGKKEPFGKIGIQFRNNFIGKKFLLCPFLIGGVSLDSRFSQNKNKMIGFSSPLGLGIEARVKKSLALTIKTQYQLSLYNSNDNLQISIGIVKFFNPKRKSRKEKERESKAITKDFDMDGIYDRFDKCPNRAGPTALGGCPDNDKDGIPNHLDNCPNEVGFKKFGGCQTQIKPFDEKDILTEKTGIISKPISLNFQIGNIGFEFGQDVLKTNSFEVLNHLVLILKEHKNYNLKIIGHTDSIGSSKANLLL